eukprot:TRINITY_DN27077_c0_g1_i1.p1 TRINITY_DN27077_c0_g1~~TRINITY_DN27077_c0_g1_i1.p1  ORF type:complete len:295 (+),score=96.76 TRINITY_DN27077_c0_g1_i1:87-887(+)
MVRTLGSYVFKTKTLSYVVGGGLFAYSSWNTYRWYASKWWPRVDGRVLAMYPYRAWLGDDKHRYHIDYTYEYKGEQYFGAMVETGSFWRLWMGNFMRDSVGDNEIKRGRLRPGQMVKVFVNPADPRDAALFRLADSFHNGFAMGIGATIAFGGYFILPRGHRLPILDKMRWVWRRRILYNTSRTRVIDVVFDRDAETQAWRHPEESGWKSDPARREKMGLGPDAWDRDVQRVRSERIARDRQLELEGKDPPGAGELPPPQQRLPAS